MNLMCEPKIYVYIADTSPLFDKVIFDRIYSSVSEQRQKKIDRLIFEKDKCLSLCAEYLLICACRDFGVDYGNEIIVTGSRSKPHFLRSEIKFNISHSEKTVMCVMSDYEVGCDVEKIHDFDIRIAKRFFTDSENIALCNCKTDAERKDLFYKIWTLKESFIKCTGQGLGLPLGSFSVISDNKIQIEQSVDNSEYLLFDHGPENGYCYALCINTKKQKGSFTNKELIREQIQIHRKY